MVDLVNNIEAVLALELDAVATANNTTGAIIDLQGAGSVTIIVYSGASSSTGKAIATIKHGDAANLADGVAVDAADLIGTPLPTDDLGANTVHSVGYRGGKRYLQVNGTYKSGTSLVVGATVVKGDLALRGVL